MPLYTSAGKIVVKNGSLATTQNCCCCSCPSCPTPVLPLTVYRTGGFAFSPTNAAGCTPVEIGQITTTQGFVTVYWPPLGTAPGSSYNSVELQVKDACGRCVWSANRANNASVRAEINVFYDYCFVGAPFVNTPPWCNNPMCPLPWT